MERLLESDVRIKFEDCDPFGHLNNSKYLDYFLDTRSEQLKKFYNVNIFDHLAETGNTWVIGSHQISYLSPVTYRDNVIIKTKLLKYGKSDLLIEAEMYAKNTNKLVSVLWTKFIYVNIKNNTKEIHTEKFIKLFNEICDNKILIEIPNFEKRVKVILLAGRRKR